MQGTFITEGRYFTVSEAAKELGKHRSTVFYWIRESELQVTRIGNAVMISEEVLRDMAARPDRGDHPPRGRAVVQGVQKINGTYYTIEGAAAELGKHRNTISRWIKEDRMPVTKIGNAVLISEEAICALLRNTQFETERPD